MKQKIAAYLAQFKKTSPILIQGLGLNGGGVSSALFFLKNGFQVIITDLKSEQKLIRSIDQLKQYAARIQYVLGEHREKDFARAGLIVKGPGVPPDNHYIQVARQNNVPITSDIDIFMQIAPCPVYAVTGSKGKSTVTSALYEIFKAQTNNSFLGGNITNSPLNFYEKLNPASLVILELSSWQLRDIKNRQIRFRGAAITNILKDHQNYYQSMPDYISDKAVICDNQLSEDFLIIPRQDQFLKKSLLQTRARIFHYSPDNLNSNIHIENGLAFINGPGHKLFLFSLDDIKVPGRHMLSNLLLAAAFAFLSGINPAMIRMGIQNFKGVAYRLQLVRQFEGIDFINDTTATIPEAAVMALQSFSRPIIWIAGGSDKNLNFSILEQITHIPQKIFLLSGDGTEKMKPFLKRTDWIESTHLEELVAKALKAAPKGSVILFSPACTSFGLFENEFDRGDAFNRIVEQLTSAPIDA